MKIQPVQSAGKFFSTFNFCHSGAYGSMLCNIGNDPMAHVIVVDYRNSSSVVHQLKLADRQTCKCLMPTCRHAVSYKPNLQKCIQNNSQSESCRPLKCAHILNIACLLLWHFLNVHRRPYFLFGLSRR